MQITPLPQGFGAEVSDCDPGKEAEAGVVACLQQAFRDHHLLIFRSAGPISPERQVEVAGWFGPVIVEGDAAWSVLDNAEPGGRFRLPFHSDTSFVEFPLTGLSLYPQSLPANETSTTFVSGARAWQELPEALRHELQDRKARHYLAHEKIDLGRPFFEYWHPVCMRHPETGVPFLFVSENHVQQIEGLSDERCAEVLQILFSALYAPERQYEHIWGEGDLLVWNNYAIQHARTRRADVSSGRRIMRRVQLGSMGFSTQVERLRREIAA